MTVEDDTTSGGGHEQGDGSMFDEYYYAHDCGLPYGRDENWLRLFDKFADGIIREFAPTRVLDVGCAMGLLVESLRRRGVDAWGIDLSEFAIGQVHESVKPNCAVNSATGDLPEHFPKEFDLVTCIEVVEHLPADDAEPAIANLARWGRRVLYSSSPHDYAEATHLNVLPAEEWAALFARHGMVRDFDVDCSFLTPWAASYEHASLSVPYVVKRYERRFERYHRENIDLRGSVVRMQTALATADRSREAAERELGTAVAAQGGLAEELDDVKALLAQANERAEGLASSLTELQVKSNELHVQYEAAVGGRDALQAEVASQREAMVALEHRGVDDRRQYDLLAAQLAAASRRADELRTEKSALRESEQAAAAALAGAREELAMVKASRTWRYGWRLSAPLRWGRGG